jgi:hypothetical protein
VEVSVRLELEPSSCAEAEYEATSSETGEMPGRLCAMAETLERIAATVSACRGRWFRFIDIGPLIAEIGFT